MAFWEIFWQVVLVVSVVLFAGLAVVVTFGGLADIRAMFRTLDQQHEGESRDERHGD